MLHAAFLSWSCNCKIHFIKLHCPLGVGEIWHSSQVGKNPPKFKGNNWDVQSTVVERSPASVGGTSEPPHDKTNKMACAPAKTRISLGICPVWSESWLTAWRKLGSLATHWVHSEDSDQTGGMPRLIWVFTGRTATLLILSWGGSSTLNKLHIYGLYLWCVKQICVFEHSVMLNFNCTCPAIQRGQGSGFLSEGSSWLTACMSEKQRFWRDCMDAQAPLNLRCSHRW